MVGTKGKKVLALQIRNLWWGEKAAATETPAAEKKPAEKKPTGKEKPAAHTELCLFHKGQLTVDS